MEGSVNFSGGIEAFRADVHDRIDAAFDAIFSGYATAAAKMAEEIALEKLSGLMKTISVKNETDQKTEKNGDIGAPVMSVKKGALPISIEESGRVLWNGETTAACFRGGKKARFTALIENGGELPIDQKGAVSVDDFLKNVQSAREWASKVNARLKTDPVIAVCVAVVSDGTESRIFLRKIEKNKK